MNSGGPLNLTTWVSEAFEMFDRNKDGKIDFNEFKETWNYIGLKADDDELRRIFDQFDTNKDGLISDAEFIEAILEEV